MIPVRLARIQDQIDFAQRKWDRAQAIGNLWERQFWHGKLSGLRQAKMTILDAERPLLSAVEAQALVYKTT